MADFQEKVVNIKVIGVGGAGNNVINRMLDPIRQRRAEYEKDIPEIFNILKQGSESARETAAQTMDDVRRAMRIDYFDDAELIRQQSEKFKR